MKLPLISKLGALTGVLARLNPMALLKRNKGGDDDEHSTSVIEEEEEDLFGDLGDLDARDAEIKAAAVEASGTADDDDDNFPDDDDDDDEGNFPDENDADEEKDPFAEELGDEAKRDAQAIADLEAMPDFDEAPDEQAEDDAGGIDLADFDDGFDDDDEDEDAVREKRKKLLMFGGGGLAAAIVLGGVSWMIWGGGEAAPDTAANLPADGTVFSLDALPPLKKPTPAPSAALSPPHAPAAQTPAAPTPPTAPAAPVPQKPEPGTLSGGNLIASSGLGAHLADLGLDKVQQPGMGIVVPSSTAASYAGLPAWPPSAALTVAPLSNLVKQTDIGPLPMVAEDGYSSFKAYARPATEGDAALPQIAIVVTGLGISRASTEAAIASMPSDVTFSLDIYARGLDFWVKKMREKGHEVLIEMPSEPANFPFDDPGPAALRSIVSLDENIQKLEFILSRTAGYFGVLAVYGGNFLKDEDQVQGIMRELKRRGLMYVDGGAKESKGTRMAYKVKLPWAAVELNIDEAVGKAAVLRQLKELETLALKRSMTIARISATPLSLKYLSTWLQALPSKKMRLVPVSALANKQLIR